jgi:hypothetical protein
LWQIFLKTRVMKFIASMNYLWLNWVFFCVICNQNWFLGGHCSVLVFSLTLLFQMAVWVNRWSNFSLSTNLIPLVVVLFFSVTELMQIFRLKLRIRSNYILMRNLDLWMMILNIKLMYERIRFDYNWLMVPSASI